MPFGYVCVRGSRAQELLHTLKKCHEYDPVDKIMVLSQHFTKWSRMNASENFHMQLHKCIVKLPMKLHMTFRYAMHVSIKIYIILYSEICVCVLYK